MPDSVADTGVVTEPSAWAPLRERAFALIWFAAVVSNIGTWMHDVAAAWLMTTLAPEPLMVALVQAATSLPIFMFALPAGALADLIDRRRLLLGLQACAGVLAVILAVVVATGAVTPGLLLLFTFMLGTIAALGAPAWQAMTPDLVPKPLLAQAVALNGVGINIARAIGPALGGLVITALGIARPFALNAVSFVAVILALWLWRREAKPTSALPAERFFAAIRAGLRYARSSAQLRATLVRSAGFFLFGSALWALLPLFARGPLAGGPGLYGALLTGVGTGAVAGALLLPPLKARLGADLTVASGTAALALVMALLGLFPHLSVALPACVLAARLDRRAFEPESLRLGPDGLGPLARPRGQSCRVLRQHGAGQHRLGLARRHRGDRRHAADRGRRRPGRHRRDLALEAAWQCTLDLSPSAHWPVPILVEPVAGEGGPVLVTVEYEIDPDDAPAFTAAIALLGHERRRDGAFFWHMFVDAENPAGGSRPSCSKPGSNICASTSASPKPTGTSSSRCTPFTGAPPRPRSPT